MNEHIEVVKVANLETQKFVRDFISGLMDKYRSIWAYHKEILLRYGEILPQIMFDTDMLRIHQIVGNSGKTVFEMEARGIILQKFPGAIEQMLIEEIELPLPDFLEEELLGIRNVMSTKGTILDSQGKRVKSLDSRVDKKGGIIRIFDGYQIALKIKYGTTYPEGDVVPTINPTDISLLPVSLIKGKYWYDQIYLK